MNILLIILSSIIAALILVLALGININTYICGQTEDVSKSLVIPGILSPKECNKCHQIIVVKSCCSNKVDELKVEDSDHDNDKGCCEDILEYCSFDYLTNVPFVQDLVFPPSVFAIEQNHTFYRASKRITHPNKTQDPYVVDIMSLKCSFLI